MKKHLCSNFLYDGSKLTITIKEPFMALLKFAIFKNGASNGRELEDNCVFVAHQTLHETELMLNIKKWIRA